MNTKSLKVKAGLVLGIAVIALSTQAVARTMIKNTRHNLSNWSPYKAYVMGETNQVCVFCHAPHNAESAQASDWAPLWNHKNTETTTFMLASSTHVTPGVGEADSQPKGISKKCLSCHDGTVAVGGVTNRPRDATPDINNNILMSGYRIDPTTKFLTGPNKLGTDLRSGHVISFVYKNVSTQTAGLKDWASGITDANKASMFDRDGKMHCHSCHDPHNDWCNDSSKTVGRDPLWRKACDGGLKNSVVCEVCHNTTFSGYTREYPF